MSKRRKILDHYEPRIHPGRENFDVLDWASAESQQKRFSVLAQAVDLEGKTLLDVGCGLGDLLGFLRKREISVDYTGVDLSEKMLDAARRKQPAGRFIHADVFAETSDESDGSAPAFSARSFDVVFCSGIFNLNLGNNAEFISKAITRLMELSRRYVVFNLLHARATIRTGRYAFYDPEEIMAEIRPAGWEVRLIDDYLPNDFTVVCRRVEEAAAK